MVLDGVTLDIGVDAVWPGAGAKFIEALQVTGRPHAPVLRKVRLRQAAPARCDIVAAKANLRPDGGLELFGVSWLAGRAPGGRQGDFCFWLAGPLAGQLTALAPSGGTGAQIFSGNQSSGPPAP